MWLLPSNKNELVTITINPHRLICSWIRPSKKHAPLELKAYQEFPLPNLELEKLVIFNPTRIKKHINSFLASNKLLNARIACTLAGPSINERLVTCARAHPDKKEIIKSQKQHWHWEYCYLYPHDNGKFVFYRCGIPRPLLFQYQLLATTTGFNLSKITTERMALFTLYRHLWGTAFRPSQFALHMAQHNNMIEQLFSPDTLARVLSIDMHSIPMDDALLPLLTACGLYISERQFHERH